MEKDNELTELSIDEKKKLVDIVADEKAEYGDKLAAYEYLLDNGAKVILLTHYDDAPGTALADVVLLCGAKESPLDSGSMPVKLAVLFVANVLVLRYTLDNQELVSLSRERTTKALGNKLL